MKTAKFEKTIVIVTILFINICLLIPVWQSAVNSQLKAQIGKTEQLLKEKEEEKMVLKAKIAMQTTPEYLIEQSVARNIVFTQIQTDVATRVANSSR